LDIKINSSIIDIEGKKKCKECERIKDLDEFVKRDRNTYRNVCKECSNLKRRKKSLGLSNVKEGYKCCAKCHEELPLDSFNKRIKREKYTYFSYCKTCEHEYDQNKYNHICEQCGTAYNSGKKKSKICKQCQDIKFTGETNPMYGIRRFGKNNPNYNLDKSDDEREQGRYIEGYEIWRKAVYKRDNYTCQCCRDSKGGNLNAHHLDGYNWCKEKRVDVNNGVTLCVDCHKEFHYIYNFGNNTYRQFEEFKLHKIKSYLISTAM